MRYYVITIFMVISLISYSRGHGGVTGFQQRINIDAKFMSLADAYDAITYDSSSIYYNPGGLVNIKDTVLFVSYMPVWDNLTHIYFVGAGFDTGFLPLGIGVINIGSTGIKERSDSPEVIDLLDYQDISLFASTGLELVNGFSIGVRGGFYYQKVSTYHDWGAGLDASFLWRVKNPYDFTKSRIMRILQPISFGVIFYNILPPEINLYEKSIKFPLMVKGSLSYRFRTAWNFLDTEIGLGIESISELDSYQYNTGIEFKLWKIFYIRGGYKIEDEIFTLGS
ncbi:MAG: hypothetical protein JW827_07125, partial [Spirochaetes bacterium]|nr:hypothetical protein [Spirochaetota bacterium]